MNPLPKRKRMRLKGYYYSQPGAYFITVCTEGRLPLFWAGGAVGAIINRPQLSEYGITVEEAIRQIPVHYPYIAVDKFVVMPNHFHMILTIQQPMDMGGRLIIAPTKSTSTVVQQLKRQITKRIGRTLWQDTYYDHIIRDETEYLNTWKYIDENPARWAEDCYYDR